MSRPRNVFRQSRLFPTDQHKFVGRVRMNGNDRAFGKARAMNGAVRHRLNERQEFDARQKVEFEPGLGTRIDERLMACHESRSPT